VYYTDPIVCSKPTDRLVKVTPSAPIHTSFYGKAVLQSLKDTTED